MELSSSDRDRIERTVREKIHDRPCSVCGLSRQTIVADGFVFLRVEQDPAVLSGGGEALPSVAVVCDHCGNTILLNALVLGLSDLVERSQAAVAVHA